MILPAGAAPEARFLLIARALRALADGYVAVLLPAYLLALGMATWQVGILSSATLLGSAFATLGGALFAAGWLAAPLAACGILKIVYDLGLFAAFRRHSANNVTMRPGD